MEGIRRAEGAVHTWKHHYCTKILCNNKVSFVYNFSMLEFVQDHSVIFDFVYNPERTDSDTFQSNQVISERFADVWIIDQFLNNFKDSFLHVVVLDLLQVVFKLLGVNDFHSSHTKASSSALLISWIFPFMTSCLER